VERVARSQAAADVLFGRAMWRTSRVGAGTDALDPAAVRVGLLFLMFRGPRPLERLGGVAPRFFFVPLACSFALGVVQGFADYCDQAAWASTVFTGLLLAACVVWRPSIVPLSNVLNVGKAAILVLAAVLLALRSVLADSSRDGLTGGASTCVIIVFVLCFVSVVQSLAGRVLLFAARARLQQDDSTGAARDLAAAAGERTEDDAFFDVEDVGDEALAVLKIPDADSAADFKANLLPAPGGLLDVPDPSLYDSFFSGTNASVALSASAPAAEKPRAAASPPGAATADDELGDLLLEVALLDIPPTSAVLEVRRLVPPAAVAVVDAVFHDLSRETPPSDDAHAYRPVLSPLAPLAESGNASALRTQVTPSRFTSRGPAQVEGDPLALPIGAAALDSSLGDNDLWGTL
jgi:hypothetical protein